MAKREMPVNEEVKEKKEEVKETKPKKTGVAKGS